ncbi:hypothetical protein [Lactobacillus brevis] [Lactiplantibacillus mudanjiangensis]|uniref:DUF2513 domain-containing protein n=1 Tax=Lactiplantibacillus mudanjiangensis TaxID=1296538 RepID=UPI001015C15D|nr:hypothetical protein [Lactobacillus brevis] [Lactiplantibacillus mudanjiangensis]
MKLDHDCARDVLLLLEQTPFKGDQDVSFMDIINHSNILKYYQQESVLYAYAELVDGGFIDGRQVQQIPIDYAFVRITYKGHEFLDNIRNDSTWKKTKKTVSSKIGTASLSILSSVAAKVIEHQLGL